MKFTINEVEKKTTSTGKTYQRVIATSVEGEEIKASIWDDAGFGELSEGQEIDGAIKRNGDFINIISNTPKTFNKGGAVTKAMERKEQSISKFQEAKTDSIKMSSACRDATQLIISYPEILTNPELEKQIKSKWEELRAWLYERSEDAPKDFTKPF